MANSLEPLKGGGIASSGHGTVTSVRRLPWSWRRPSTTALNVRSLEWWKGRVRRRSTRSTQLSGDRSDLLWGRGQESRWTLSRRLRKPRSVTWLSGLLSWWWRRWLAATLLWRTKEEEEERRRVEEVKAAEKHEDPPRRAAR